MIKYIYQLQKTNNGYQIIGNGSVYVMNISNRNNGSSYYLKQIKPMVKYITGLFYKKKYNCYQGKTIDNQKIIIKLGFNIAEIMFF